MWLCLLHASPLRSSLSSKTCSGRAEKDRLLLVEPLRVPQEEWWDLSGGGESVLQASPDLWIKFAKALHLPLPAQTVSSPALHGRMPSRELGNQPYGN